MDELSNLDDGEIPQLQMQFQEMMGAIWCEISMEAMIGKVRVVMEYK